MTGPGDLCHTKTPYVSSPLAGTDRCQGEFFHCCLDDAGKGLKRRNVAIDHAVIAGWTGRDAAAVEKHIKELEVLGVKRPATTPIFYRVAASRLDHRRLASR